MPRETPLSYMITVQKKRNALFLISASGVLFLFVFFFSFFNPFSNTKSTGQAKEYLVELHEDGFSPKLLRIQKGDTVVFSTTRGEPFWPASNLHPSHTIYPEFDPKEPIEANEKWNFTLDRAGKWKYHDHLAPISKGEIVVSEKGSADGSGAMAETCRSGAYEKQCWEELISTTLQIKGVETALDILYDNQAYFANNCHDLAHTIGESAYRVFSQGKAMVLTPKTYYCGYGFYHGFMETLMQTTGSVEQAREFCAYAEKQLAGQTGDAGGSCYHGIGHGTVDGGDPRSWGDAKAVIAPGLEICERVGSTDTQIDRCASGVFNSLAIAYNSSSYGFSLPRENPYGICEEQVRHYFKKPCYEEMNTTVIRLGNSFAQSARYVEDIADDVYANHAIESLASYAVFSHPSRNNEDIIFDCRSLQQRLRFACIRGFAGGLVEHAAPESEYVESLAFCSSSVLTQEEHHKCFNRLVFYLGILYPPEKLRKICETIEEQYREYCP